MCGKESEKLFQTVRQRNFGNVFSVEVSKKHNLIKVCFLCVSEIVPTHIDEKHQVIIKIS